MARYVWIGSRLGATAGITSGAIVGLIAGFGGSLFTGSLPDLAAFAVSVFLLVLAVLPLVFYRSLLSNTSIGRERDRVRDHSYTVAAAAWLPAFLLSVVAFMMPVVMVPLILGKGVTFENSADWYGQVYSALLGWRLVLVAMATLIGLGVAAYAVRIRHSYS